MTTDTVQGMMDGERFSWIERPDDDFPYYRGQPVAISDAGWGFVLLAVAAAFFALILLPAIFHGGLIGLIPAILFVVIPLLALARVAGRGWKALFRTLRAADFVWMFAFFVLNLVVTLVVGYVVTALFDAHANPAGSTVAAASTVERVFFFIRTGIQLFGEELLTILPFLALLYWLVAHRGMGRKPAVILAAISAAIVFALVHLPTYQWNLPQALVGLVPVRLVLLTPYIMTKNIWVSTGTHILNDWAIFGLPTLLAAGGEG